MPIRHDVKIEPISEDAFHCLDHRIMGLFFSMHKDLGRFYDERIYQNELAYRCRSAGFETVATEVPIQVHYQDFLKIYHIDIMINNSVIYELKTVKSLTGEHRKQALNYLLLMGMRHGKLVNMRPQSVEHRFVSTQLTPGKRYEFTIEDLGWKDFDQDSIWLRKQMTRLLSEWGAFLDTNLFYDAISHFRGGEGNVVRRIEIANDSRILGTQRAHLLNPEIAFKISAVTKGGSHYEQHLQRFIRYTSLKAIQWINFNHHQIEFTTIAR